MANKIKRNKTLSKSKIDFSIMYHLATLEQKKRKEKKILLNKHYFIHVYEQTLIRKYSQYN